MKGGMTPKRLTKRQRKALIGWDEQGKRSLKDGEIQMVGQTRYIGTPPVYTSSQAYLMAPIQYHKIQAGIPFVRA